MAFDSSCEVRIANGKCLFVRIPEFANHTSKTLQNYLISVNRRNIKRYVIISISVNFISLTVMHSGKGSVHSDRAPQVLFFVWDAKAMPRGQAIFILSNCLNWLDEEETISLPVGGTN